MKRSKIPSLLFVLFFLPIKFSILLIEAMKDNGSSADSGYPGPSPVPVPPYGSNPTKSKIFDILSFGAKGDGVCDDSDAFLAAWKAACKVPGATLEIPSEFRFLIKPITLQGPCMPQFVLQIDGILLAPPEVGSWPISSLFQWLNFKWVQNFTIQGTGTVDGQGPQWWTVSSLYYTQKKLKNIPDLKPTAMRFYASYNVTVRDIKIINSPQCHLKFDSSRGIRVDNIKISSPENSPNTDGIHLQNTQEVEIQHSDIGCDQSEVNHLIRGYDWSTIISVDGAWHVNIAEQKLSGDDCVSIQTGCSNIYIQHINCGPGHGISLGSLGKDRSVGCISGIVVERISLQNTLAGVRIKTWQGGIGSIKNVSFSNIQVSDVKFPIIIDQYYCDKHFCKNQTGAVAISGIKYDQIIGTYSVQPIYLACSEDIPCTDVDLINIQLKPSPRYGGFHQGLCWNSYGISKAPLVPSSIDYCLRRDSGSIVKRMARFLEHLC